MDTYGNYLNQFTQAFGNIYGALNPPRQTPPPAANANRNARNQKWMPFAIGGGVLLVVLVLVVALTGRRK